MNKKQSLKQSAWIIIAVCVAVFFATALVVYVKAEPSNMTEYLDRDGTWLDMTELSETVGDLEKYPYVTRVYRYETNAESLSIRYVRKADEPELLYGVADDDGAEYNYCVECFVYSEIANREFVKSSWNISVQEDDGLTFTKNAPFVTVKNATSFGDLKKSFPKTRGYYATFMRITVKPGKSDVIFTDTVAE